MLEMTIPLSGKDRSESTTMEMTRLSLNTSQKLSNMVISLSVRPTTMSSLLLAKDISLNWSAPQLWITCLFLSTMVMLWLSFVLLMPKAIFPSTFSPYSQPLTSIIFAKVLWLQVPFLKSRKHNIWASSWLLWLATLFVKQNASSTRKSFSTYQTQGKTINFLLSMLPWGWIRMLTSSQFNSISKSTIVSYLCRKFKFLYSWTLSANLCSQIVKKSLQPK